MRSGEPFPAERFYRARLFVNGVATGERVDDYDVSMSQHRRFVMLHFCASIAISRHRKRNPAETCPGHHNYPKATCGLYGRPNVRSERRIAVYELRWFCRNANDDGEAQLHFTGWQAHSETCR